MKHPLLLLLRKLKTTVVSKWPLWNGTLDGAPAVFNSGNSTNISVCALSPTTVVAFYTDSANSSFATACAGTVSGTTISWGTPVIVRSSAVQVNQIVALNSSQAVVVWRDSGDSSRCKSVVLSVSGTSVSVGTIATVNSSGIDSVYAALLSPTKVIVCYNIATTEGRAVVLIISGTSISVQTAFAFNSTNHTAVDCAIEVISSSQAIVFYSDGNNASQGTAMVLDISASNIITGNSAYVFNAANTIALRSAALSATSFAVIYRDGANSNFATVQIITVSGVSLGSGSKVAYNNVAASRSLTNLCKADSSNIYLFFRQVTSNKGVVIIATLNGAAITLQTSVIVNNATSSEFACVALDNTRICALYKDQGTSNAGTGKVSKSA